jgi:hypothetical protein
MKKNKLALFFILWSRVAFGEITSTMVPLSREMKQQYSNTAFESTVSNMPRVRSQDSLGVCFGFSSAVVAQHYYCEQNKIQCNPLDEKSEISPMSMVAWANPDDVNKRAGTWTNHSNIRFGGYGYAALGHFAVDRTNTITPEACYPFDQFANRYGSNQAAVDVIILKLKAEYDKYKTEGHACEECLIKIVRNDLGAKTSLSDLAKGLEQKTFDQFLYTAYFGSCEENEISLEPPPKMNMFPKQNETADYRQVISEVKRVLASGRPLNLDSICPFYENSKCISGHSVVITGYKSLCKKEKPSD